MAEAKPTVQLTYRAPLEISERLNKYIAQDKNRDKNSTITEALDKMLPK